MAHVTYWSFTWGGVGAPGGLGSGMPPDARHPWFTFGFPQPSAIVATAYPNVGGDNPENFLAVEDIKIQTDATGSRFYFTVHNVGVNEVRAYTVSFAETSA